MNIRKLIAVFVAMAMCFSLCLTAFAVNGEENPSQENATAESTTAEESPTQEGEEESTSGEQSDEQVTEDSPSEEQPEKETTEEPSSDEQSSQAPDEDDVIALIVSLLGKIDLDKVKDAFNDINEALGLPRIESFTDIPSYADALYEKLEEMGLGYADIINGLASSDLLEWLNNLIFGTGSSKPVTTVPSDSETNDENSGESIIPDTGVSLGATAVAVAALGGSGALALLLRKRNNNE